MKIYTKTGDQGNTKLLYGDTVPKDSLAPEAYGSVDELVASLGLIRAEEKLPIEIKEILLRIQRELFIVGAELATAKENRDKLKSKKTLVDETMVEALEKEIDFLEQKNGIPEFFVVPGENIISAKSLALNDSLIFFIVSMEGPKSINLNCIGSAHFFLIVSLFPVIVIDSTKLLLKKFQNYRYS